MLARVRRCVSSVARTWVHGGERRADLPCSRLDYRLPVLQKWAVSSAVEHCFHTAGATGSIPVPPTILHQAARGASVSPIVSRLPTAVAAFWTVSSRTCGLRDTPLPHRFTDFPGQHPLPRKSCHFLVKPLRP